MFGIPDVVHLPIVAGKFAKEIAAFVVSADKYNLPQVAFVELRVY